MIHQGGTGIESIILCLIPSLLGIFEAGASATSAQWNVVGGLMILLMFLVVGLLELLFNLFIDYLASLV
jgi:hypothetical protein